MPSPLVVLLAVDPLLGKVDKSTLPQQTLMELFTEGIANREAIFWSNETPEDLSEWKGTFLNEKGEVTRVFWPHMLLEGTVNLKWSR